MKTKVILTLGCIALLAAFTTAAMADAITFSYAVSTGTVPTIANEFGSPSLTGGPVTATKVGDIVVKDTNTSLTLDLPIGSTGMIQSDNASIYIQSGGTLVAAYGGSAVTQVLVDSAFCGGNCLTGTNNFGTYTAMAGDGGGFGGVFKITFVSPAILAFFGDTGQSVNAHGGTAFTTTNNTFPTPTTDSARLGSGTITIQTTPVPEPTTLALMGTGILGLAAAIRRKRI
jgi:hypothetical protein